MRKKKGKLKRARGKEIKSRKERKSLIKRNFPSTIELISSLILLHFSFILSFLTFFLPSPSLHFSFPFLLFFSFLFLSSLNVSFKELRNLLWNFQFVRYGISLRDRRGPQQRLSRHCDRRIEAIDRCSELLHCRWNLRCFRCFEWNLLCRWWSNGGLGRRCRPSPIEGVSTISRTQSKRLSESMRKESKFRNVNGESERIENSNFFSTQ